MDRCHCLLFDRLGFSPQRHQLKTPLNNSHPVGLKLIEANLYSMVVQVIQNFLAEIDMMAH